ncbi:MAG: sulfatase-like hydrolase/transferase, partial [Akkermansiaceae bacterium]
SKTINTPHLDKLAAEGVRCTDYHSNGAVCSPTRAALMTGRYQQRAGVPGVITAKSHRHTGLALKEWTMAEAMKELGYQTAMFGKWHLGYDPKYNPTKQGFDEFKGFVSGNVDYHRHIDQEGHFDWWQQDKLKDDPGYITDLITDYSIDFIRRKKDKPFLLIVNHGAPHYPIQGRKTPGFRVTGKTNTKQPKQKIDNPKAIYKEMIEVMDEGIGKIVSELNQLGIRKNTLVIFTSDNGPARIGSAGVLRGRKGSVYEGGHRVPGIFNWPEKLPSKAECTSPVLGMDMLPTFVALAGGKVEPQRKLDGIDVMPALKGKPIKRQPLFWQHGTNTAVRDGNWKLVITKKKPQLFNLAEDPSEKHNLSIKHPDKVAHLTKLIKSWETSVNTSRINTKNKALNKQPRQVVP